MNILLGEITNRRPSKTNAELIDEVYHEYHGTHDDDSTQINTGYIITEGVAAL